MEAKAVKPIFSQTIKRMFRLKEVLIYFSIVLLPVLVVSLSTNRGNDSLYAEMKSVQGTFFILSFLWLTGIPFIINLLAHGTGLFASEEAEGTMPLLVIKPVRRYEIVLGKILALFTASMMYQVITLVLSLFVFYFLAGLDADSVQMLLKITPGILLYATVISLFFTALSSAMSVIFKKKIAGIIIALLFVFAAYGIIPAFKGMLIMTGAYEKFYLYIFDFNYHLGLLFKTFVLIFSRSGTTISAMSNIDSVIGNYMIHKNDMDVIRPPGYINSGIELTYINPVLLTAVYIILSALLFAFVFRRMNKKDLG